MIKKNANTPETVILDGSILGNLDQTVDIAKKFKDTLDKSGAAPVILDLTGIQKIFSIAIALMIGLQKECLQRNRPLKVLVANNEIISLLKMLRLDGFLTIEKVESVL